MSHIPANRTPKKLVAGGKFNTIATSTPSKMMLKTSAASKPVPEGTQGFALRCAADYFDGNGPSGDYGYFVHSVNFN
jgi:hypothetical protein